MDNTIKVNDILICKNDKPLEGNDLGPPLELEEEYEAQELYKCSCGQAHINVGLISNYNWISCYNCSSQLPYGDTIHWCHPSRFVKK